MTRKSLPNKLSNKLSVKNGFTLAEVLAALTILVVLLTLAIPGVMNIQERLKITELNDTARQIYMAAQNSLTTWQTDGTIAAFNDDMQTADADGNIWLSSHDANMNLLLPEGTLESIAAKNHYMLKLDLHYATVLEVYYAESSLLNYADSIKTGALSNETDSADKRREYKVGFYAGSKLEWSKPEQLPVPMLKIENKEELTAIVKLDGNHTELLNKTQLTLRIEELDASGAVVKTIETAPVTPDISTETKITLDSLSNDATRFKEICAGITPGANIRVTALLNPSETSNKYLPSASNSVYTNSLFELRSNDTVSISNKRHLQNLHNASGIASDIADAVQTANIDLANIDFISIANDNLKSYDGNQLKISNLNSSNGLFNNINNASLTNIRVVDPSISGSGSIGALAGEAGNTTINNCRIYAENNISDAGITAGGNYAGGLVGTADNCTINSSFSALPTLHADGTKAAGGLIGYTKGSCKITNSYAVVNHFTGTSERAAMLIGSSKSSTSGMANVNCCYAVGNLAVVGDVNGFGHEIAVNNSYCAVTYIKEDGSKNMVQNAFADGATQSTCYYLDKGVSSEQAQALSFSELEKINPNGNWNHVTAAQTHPYSAKLQGKAYPFPCIKDADDVLPFYGDWLITQVAENSELQNKNISDESTLLPDTAD